MKKIIDFGSYVTDLTSRCGRFPEAGETVKGNSFKMGPGGKGSNQAVAAHRAGADVTFVTKLGTDALGEAAMHFYRSEKMDTDMILTDPSEQTGAALIMVNEESGQNEIVVISGACGTFTGEETEKVRQMLTADCIFMSQLETNLEPVYTLMKAAKEKGALTLLNPAPACDADRSLFGNIDVLTPNETEAQYFTGIRVTGEESAKRAADVLQEMGVGNVIITLGEMGCFVQTKEKSEMIPAARAGEVIDTTGAGDCFSGCLAAALAEGKDLFEAARFAAAASAIAVTRLGTAPAMPAREEIDRVVSGR